MTTLRPQEINALIIHCSDSGWGDVHVIDQWHKERGFDLVGGHYCGYHYVILNGFRNYARMKEGVKDPNEDGAIEPGRAECYWGAHALGYNQNSLGICLIGIKDFTDNQRATLLQFVKDLQAKYTIPTERVLGHCETHLAGGKTCPNFDVAELRKLL